MTHMPGTSPYADRFPSSSSRPPLPRRERSGSLTGVRLVVRLACGEPVARVREFADSISIGTANRNRRLLWDHLGRIILIDLLHLTGYPITFSCVFRYLNGTVFFD